MLHSCGGDYSHAVAIVLERAVGYSRKVGGKAWAGLGLGRGADELESLVG